MRTQPAAGASAGRGGGDLRARIVERGGPTPAIANARAEWRERRGLLFILEDEGHRGVGEATPLPGYSRDTLEQCRDELARLDLRSIDPNDPLHLALEAPAARFAVETALLDLAAQKRGVSIADVLGKQREEVPLSSLVENADDVQRALDRGIRTVKIKSASLHAIAALRSTFDRIAIRLDANQAWSPAEAERNLTALRPLALELIEEPSQDWDRLPAGFPLALDESLMSMGAERIRTLAANRIATALILKPMALGGFSRCLELAHLAEELDLSVVVTHLFDGPVALAAALELARALPGRVLACGLDRHAGLAAWEEA